MLFGREVVDRSVGPLLKSLQKPLHGRLAVDDPAPSTAPPERVGLRLIDIQLGPGLHVPPPGVRFEPRILTPSLARAPAVGSRPGGSSLLSPSVFPRAVARMGGARNGPTHQGWAHGRASEVRRAGLRVLGGVGLLESRPLLREAARWSLLSPSIRVGRGTLLHTGGLG